MSLKRHTPLQRTKQPLRRTSIRRVSTKRARENRIYLEKRAAFLEAHPWCQWWLAERRIVLRLHREEVAPGCPRSTEIHHKHGRTGKNFLDESTWMAVSAEGHRWIHAHPSESRRKGYITK